MARKKTRQGEPRPPEYRLLATGDRHWASPDTTDRVLSDYAARNQGKRIKVIEGGAKGADAAAGDWARRIGADHIQVKADWAKQGRAAGPIRNLKMLKDHDPDAVVGFHDHLDRSKGTRNMIDLAVKHSKNRPREIDVYNSKGERTHRFGKSLSELGEIAKYNNEHDYLFDTHSEKTGESLDLGHRHTARWARKNYGTKQWWPKSEYEHFRTRGGHPVDGGGQKWKQSKDYPSRKHPEHGYRYTTSEDHDSWDARDQAAAMEEKRKNAEAKRAQKKAAKTAGLAALGHVVKAMSKQEARMRRRENEGLATLGTSGAVLGGIGGSVAMERRGAKKAAHLAGLEAGKRPERPTLGDWRDYYQQPAHEPVRPQGTARQRAEERWGLRPPGQKTNEQLINEARDTKARHLAQEAAEHDWASRTSKHANELADWQFRHNRAESKYLRSAMNRGWVGGALGGAALLGGGGAGLVALKRRQREQQRRMGA